MFRDVLGHFGMFLGLFETIFYFSDLLGHFWMFLDIPGHFGDILGHFGTLGMFCNFVLLYFLHFYCLLSTVYCLLSTVYSMLSVVYFLLYTVCCLLSSVYCLLWKNLVSPSLVWSETCLFLSWESLCTNNNKQKQPKYRAFLISFVGLAGQGTYGIWQLSGK